MVAYLEFLDEFSGAEKFFLRVYMPCPASSCEAPKISKLWVHASCRNQIYWNLKGEERCHSQKCPKRYFLHGLWKCSDGSHDYEAPSLSKMLIGISAIGEVASQGEHPDLGKKVIESFLSGLISEVQKAISS
mmetsp:Transcript_13203/g.14575  ORF Transcript_13203/g.14575 Transcript_13203/m.14575 type:complete len:132 (-) Transcript_13203:286-681(-)